MKNVLTLLSTAALVLMTSAHAAERLPTIPPDKYNAEQTKAAQDFQAARKVPVFGPFEPLMHSPEVMSQARAMGDYLRYHSAIGNTLSELVIFPTRPPLCFIVLTLDFTSAAGSGKPSTDSRDHLRSCSRC